MSRFRSLPRWAQIAIGAALALFLCCCSIVGLGAILPESEPTPPADRAAELPTAQPTDTTISPADTSPPPTDTSIPPTDTPPPPTDTSIPPTDTPPSPTDTAPPPAETPTAPANTPEPTEPPAQAAVAIANVFNSGMKEHVEIANQGTTPQDMSGWYVHGSKGDEMYFYPGGYTLAAGATMRLHSGEDGIHAPPADIYWIDKPVWNNKGETVFLRDGQGNIVSEYKY